MNYYDRINIDRIIKVRNGINKLEASLCQGGELDINMLQNLSTEELNKMLEFIQQELRNKLITKLKDAIDAVFNAAPNPDANTIMLAEYYVNEYDVCEIEYAAGLVQHLQLDSYNNWCITVDLTNLPKEAFKRYAQITNIIFCDLNIEKPDEFEPGNDEGINEYWHGCVAVTKDYKIVSFIDRGDMLADEHINGPDVIMEL